MLSTAAFNALLKTLEEPPEHVIFVLATTEIHKIPATVLSRCQRFEFRRIPLEDIVEHLRRLAAAEAIEVEPEALDLIARAATGSMRDAISLLDQMAAEGAVTGDHVRLMLGAERREVVQALIEAWLDDDLSQGLALINPAVDGGADPRQLARQLADFLRGLLLMRLGAGETWLEPTQEERPRYERLAQRTDPDGLVKAVRLFSEVATERNAGWQPQLPLELAFVALTLKPEEVAAQPAPASQPETVATPAPAQREPSRPTTRTSQPKPAASPPPASSPTGTLSISQLDERWKDAINQIRRVDVSLSALLNDARPIDRDSTGAVVLGFRHKFHRNKVSSEEQLRVVDELLSTFFNQPLRVRCVLEKEWQGTEKPPKHRPQSAPPPPPEMPPEPEDEDLLVQRAVNELGAVPKEVD